ncbi:beta-lactamase/transpeptidase-like protein [Xylaria bambusicola]|uniref:beta-lactamase/transpeptidase-like protein n=1 Tax=Xylaria bambusicola TaxID=326684 RepID=UPI0020089764|nr:beta-lactamase/transpeptidase-like protein [Xylaria bambusicola]KAI0509758.1 beta-lactamase/transpeptidase-like protein [Xylaria bambusicola]
MARTSSPSWMKAGWLRAASLLLLASFITVEASLDCRAPGPVVPKPRHIHGHERLVKATTELSGKLEDAVMGEIKAGWPVEETSFSIGVIAHDQENAAVPVWEYHYLSPANVNGTKDLSRDSQFLIGSISKVISDYILLMSGIDIDESVAEFVPELRDEASAIRWGDITLRHLATQVAGIPPNYGFSEYYYLKDYFESLGFPHVEDEAYAECGIIGLNGGCTREQFLKGMLESHPVAQPAERPVYSNIAFTLLMYAVESRTGMNYTELLRTYVSDPLALKNTIVSPGDDDKAVIPPVDNSWGSDYGDNAPGGGLVSSLSDLSIFIHAILDGTIFGADNTTAVREWLKPTSSTGSLYSLVGTPWEIYRTNELISHTVDLYAKGGSAYGYQSQMALVDEYGVGIVVLTAGSPLASGPIYDAVLATMVPALDDIAREQARQRGYTGVFVDGNSASCGNGSSADFNVTVVQDADSLVLHGVERNGTDILASLREIWTVTIGGFLAVTPSTARIFPIQIRKEVKLPMADGSEKKVVREDWRLDWDFLASGETDLPGAGLSNKNCLAWTLTDWMYYGSEPIDRIVFVLDAETEEVIGLEIPYLRSDVLVPVTIL